MKLKFQKAASSSAFKVLWFLEYLEPLEFPSQTSKPAFDNWFATESSFLKTQISAEFTSPCYSKITGALGFFTA